MVDLVTAIGTGREAANKSDNPAVGPGEASDTDKTASASPDNPDNLVALVLARPEISSLSDLNNKSVAIEEKQSASSGRVSAALMAAGAAEVQFSEAKADAIERLISGEVPAAVLTLAFARSGRVVSRHQRLQDVSGPAFDEGAALASIARMRDLSAGSSRSVGGSDIRAFGYPCLSLRSCGPLADVLGPAFLADFRADQRARNRLKARSVTGATA